MSNGRTSRPAARSASTQALLASATPSPSIAALMTRWLGQNEGPRVGSTSITLARRSHAAQSGLLPSSYVLLSCNSGAAYREHFDRQAQLRMHPRIDTSSVANVDVIVVARKVDGLRRRRHLEVDLGMLLQKALHSRDQPLDDERGRNVHLECLRISARMQLARRLGQLPERLFDGGKVCLPRLRQHQRVRLPVKQLHAEAFLERLDLVANCGGSDEQLLGRSREAQVLCCDGECSQRIEGG